MSRHMNFLKITLDAVPERAVLINEDGGIMFANQAWTQFGAQNGARGSDWTALNYLDECDRAASDGCDMASRASAEIRAVLAGLQRIGSFQYPCDEPDRKRWFRMITSTFDEDGARYAVVLHRDITAAVDLRDHETATRAPEAQHA